jgi:DNA-binding transcriptional regulator YdaS (Cro superfamily)
MLYMQGIIALFSQTMKLGEFLARERGRAASLARLLKVAPSYLSQLARGNRPVPPDRASAIESATYGIVRRWDLRPHDWWQIWPELVGADGAPPAPPGEASTP